ncbi:hypothetical protein [Streptomyces griseus]|uniref:hypothetical protein n=1 Tax=Streptomyces griseus TaxID=1911 RepID=UPI001586D5D7|nr:hypothetical protein [Streptomyces griseus]
MRNIPLTLCRFDAVRPVVLPHTGQRGAHLATVGALAALSPPRPRAVTARRDVMG